MLCLYRLQTVIGKLYGKKDKFCCIGKNSHFVTLKIAHKFEVENIPPPPSRKNSKKKNLEGTNGKRDNETEK